MLLLMVATWHPRNTADLLAQSDIQRLIPIMRISFGNEACLCRRTKCVRSRSRVLPSWGQRPQPFVNRSHSIDWWQPPVNGDMSRNVQTTGFLILRSALVLTRPATQCRCTRSADEYAGCPVKSTPSMPVLNVTACRLRYNFSGALPILYWIANFSLPTTESVSETTDSSPRLSLAVVRIVESTSSSRSACCSQ